MRLIIDNYPVNSIKDIKDSWSSPLVELFDGKISLDQIEHEVIRKNYNEPRIHFALVCAAKGCPELINEPYLSNRLEEQLDSSTKKFLNRNDQTISILQIRESFSPRFLIGLKMTLKRDMVQLRNL